MQKLLLIAAAGAAGTLARYGLAGLAQRCTSHAIPIGTAAVNLFGCFLFGTFWSIASTRLTISPEVRTAVLVGFMGAFTTFSSFAFETTEMLGNGGWLLALANIALQNTGGIALTVIGMAFGRAI